jgi:predicted RNA-binding Zn-ribbon protein involved in translation (DUF1610 family)
MDELRCSAATHRAEPGSGFMAWRGLGPRAITKLRSAPFQEMRMKSNTAKLLIAVLLLIVAIVIFVKFGTGRSETPGLAEDAKKLDFVCAKCGAHSQLTYDEMRKASADAGAEQASEDETQQRVRGRRMKAHRPAAIACPKCGEKAAIQAAHCDQHNVYYPVENLDGAPGKCPKCP